MVHEIVNESNPLPVAAEHVNLRDALEFVAGRRRRAAAIQEQGREPLDYERLCAEIDYVRHALGASGVTGADRVAVILPPSTELSVALLGAACAAPVAPLNVENTIDEIRAYLAALDARSVVTVAGSAGARAAQALGLPVLEVVLDRGLPAGAFRFAGHPFADVRRWPRPSADDIGAIFLTSGTTGRSKRVPLTHRIILTRAQRTIDQFELTAEDHLLDPTRQGSQFSFVSALLPALLSGGTVTILEAFEPERLSRRLNDTGATWMVSGPTHLQALLSALDRGVVSLDDHRLRVVRSGTGHLPEDVASRLEAYLGVPIAVGYGMVETGQIARSPTPPERRKPGTVGHPSAEIKLVDAQGRRVGRGEQGEILVRGPQVFTGYLDDPEANAAAFEGGWLRTGDLGYIDEDGCLVLVGRTKEIINRGGQSIAPMEIDDVLLSHPAVAEAAVFPVPHRTLGEDVAAAVVAKTGMRIDERELTAHVADRLSLEKVPRRIVLLDVLPRGENEKISRRRLTEQFGSVAARVPDGPPAERASAAVDSGQAARVEDDLAAVPPASLPRPELETAYVAPGNPLEARLASIWADVLCLETVGVDDGFLDLGGDSLTATQVIARVQDEFGVRSSVRMLFESATVAEMARFVERKGAR